LVPGDSVAHGVSAKNGVPATDAQYAAVKANLSATFAKFK